MIVQGTRVISDFYYIFFLLNYRLDQYIVSSNLAKILQGTYKPPNGHFIFSMLS
jgi:hypothetical protein